MAAFKCLCTFLRMIFDSGVFGWCWKYFDVWLFKPKNCQTDTDEDIWHVLLKLLLNHWSVESRYCVTWGSCLWTTVCLCVFLPFTWEEGSGVCRTCSDKHIHKQPDPKGKERYSLKRVIELNDTSAVPERAEACRSHTHTMSCN